MSPHVLHEALRTANSFYVYSEPNFVVDLPSIPTNPAAPKLHIRPPISLKIKLKLSGNRPNTEAEPNPNTTAQATAPQPEPEFTFDTTESVATVTNEEDEEGGTTPPMLLNNGQAENDPFLTFDPEPDSDLFISTYEMATPNLIQEDGESTASSATALTPKPIEFPVGFEDLFGGAALSPPGWPVQRSYDGFEWDQQESKRSGTNMVPLWDLDQI